MGTNQILKDEYEQAVKRGGTTYADHYCEGLEDGIKYSISKELWVSVEDRPLVRVYDNGDWEATKDGSGEFLAAVPYTDANDGDGRTRWWIRHCVIQDEIGLSVVEDDDVVSAGWNTTDITHYFPIPIPPIQ